MNPTKRIERNHEHRDHVRADDWMRDSAEDVEGDDVSDAVQPVKEERDDHLRMWQEQVDLMKKLLAERADRLETSNDES